MEIRKQLRTALFLFLLATALFISGCGNEGSGRNMSYEETKTMVMDILKSDDGKQVIDEVNRNRDMEIHNSELMHMLTTPEGQQIKAAVKEVLTDPSFPKVLQQLMTDPKFAGEFAKAVQAEDKELHKKLMKDPEYQTMMLDIMKNDEFKQLIFDVLKDKDYRKQNIVMIQEALETPTFKLELMDLLKKIIREDELMPEEQKAKEEETKKKEDEKTK